MEYQGPNHREDFWWHWHTLRGGVGCSKATGQSLYHPPLASAGTINPEAAKARRRKGPAPPTCGTARLRGSRPLAAGQRPSPGTATGARALGRWAHAGRGCSGDRCAGRRAAGPAGSCKAEGRLGASASSLPKHACLGKTGGGRCFLFQCYQDSKSHQSLLWTKMPAEFLTQGAVKDNTLVSQSSSESPAPHENISQGFTHTTRWYILSCPKVRGDTEVFIRLNRGSDK